MAPDIPAWKGNGRPIIDMRRTVEGIFWPDLAHGSWPRGAAGAVTCGDVFWLVVFHALRGFVLGSRCGVHPAGADGVGSDGGADRRVRRGRQRIVEHVGSAHSEAELGVLLASAPVSCWSTRRRMSSTSASSRRRR